MADELTGTIIPELAKMTELEFKRRKTEQAHHNYQRPPNQSYGFK